MTAGLMGLAAGERRFAAGVGGLLERALPGRERLYRPAGHLAALWLLGGAVYELMRRVDRRVERVEAVMGEPAAAEPIRVFVGLESAASEAERVALALAELERTRAFDRSLLMVISPTGTG